MRTMEVIKCIDSFRTLYQDRTVVALGNFDGVHKGHQEILHATVAAAKRIGGKSAVLIFMPHPLSVLTPDKSPALLLRAEDRIRLLGEEGIDYVIVHPFSREFAAIPPESFAAEILHGKLRVSGVVVGYDYSFGRCGSGTPEDLAQLGSKYSFFVEVIQPVSVEGKPVGSTAIRQFLTEGRVEAAAAMLGYPFYLRGTVVHGDGRGKTLGFPTANLLVPCDVIRPGFGVYLARASYKGRTHWALTNIGKRPTFCKDEPSIEVHLLDDKKNIYQQELFVEFLQKIRDEQAFKSVAELTEQIRCDVLLARELISRRPK